MVVFTKLLLASLISLTLAAAAHAEKRIALVIGNSAYQFTGELKNPRNDAADMAAALKALKFEVVEGVDLDKRNMEITIRKFALLLKSADIAVFFYAGHGLQVNGQNYLVPIDARLEDATGLDFEMIRLDLVHRAMERETKANLIFLDACRDNPLARNLARAMGTRSGDVGHGLAPVESGVGTLISFSTQPGNVALDGEGRNSPFASALARRIRTEGEDLSSILIGVRNDVMEATRNRQIPWEHSALRSKIFFSAPPSSPGSMEAAIELAYWNAAQIGASSSTLKSYLDRYPQGAYAGAAKLMIDKLRLEEESRADLAKREADLRKAEEVQRLAESKHAAEQKKAEESKRSEELAKAREEAQRAQAAVRIAEAERLAAIKAAEEARKEAEAAKPSVKMASAPPAAATTPQQAITDASSLARSLQAELKRVGCDPGPADGNWGSKAREALAEFARHAKVGLKTEAPTEDALQRLLAYKGRACPLQCGAGQMEKGGKCVARATPGQPAKTEAASRPNQPREAQANRCAVWQKCADGVVSLSEWSKISTLLNTCGAKPSGC